MKFVYFPFTILLVILGSGVFFLLTGNGYLVTHIFTQDIYIPFVSGPEDEDEFDEEEEIPIPKASDWVDYGPVLEAGPEGSWDFIWGGFTPASVVKKENTYYFYYVAADGFRSFDGEERHRAIGVATSQDGIHFTKYSGNPVMTYSQFDGEEEGANSGGVTLDSSGNFVLYYGAAYGPESRISADGRVAVSSDGFTFTDLGTVLDHRNPLLYGFGDEIFPQAAFHHDGNWYVFYEPNGATASRTLGVAWGNEFDNLPISDKVLDEQSGGKPVGTWGNVISLSPEKIALFIQRLWWPDTFIEVRTASPDLPYQLSEPVEIFEIPNLKRGVVFLDREVKTWFMYYNDFDRFWDVKLAPAGDPDETPPSTPASLSALPESYDQILLSWDPAVDPDTGVVIYRIFRDGIEIGSTKDLTYTDTGRIEESSYEYEVNAVNFHGFEGPAGVVSATTPADTTPPAILHATTNADPTQLTVVFDEKLDSLSAEVVENYAIDNGIIVESALLQEDAKTVILTTSEHSEDILYTLTVNNISDQATSPNKMNSAAQWIYTYSPIEGLAGFWDFQEQGSSSTSADFSGFGNTATIHGAEWQNTGAYGAMYFDGQDDYLQVEDIFPLDQLTHGSFTITALVNPEEAPLNSNGYGIVTRVGINPSYFIGLTYTQNREYQAKVITTDGSTITLNSGTVEPGEWHRLTMGVDDNNKQIFLYVDGEPVSDSPQNFSGELVKLGDAIGGNVPSGDYYFGSTKPDLGGGSFFTHYFKGWIAEVRVYNRALMPEEIK